MIRYKSFDGREIPAWYYRPQIQATVAWSFVRSGEDTQWNAAARHGNNQCIARRKCTLSAGREGCPSSSACTAGRRDKSSPAFSAIYQYFLSRGYAILAPNVRGSTGYGKTFTHLDDVRKREDSVKDLAAAVEWLKTEGGADPKRIAVMGGSYGGYMTLAAITLYPDLWAAAVDTVRHRQLRKFSEKHFRLSPQAARSRVRHA